MAKPKTKIKATAKAVTKATTKEGGRRRAVSEMKRQLILDAARRIFEAEGLDGASLRAIAGEAGYTPAALYFHFSSREEIYGAVLEQSLARLKDETTRAAHQEQSAKARLKSAALAFFQFYAENPRDLDLGFYLFRGGMKPKGLGASRDKALNAALGEALDPVLQAAQELGADEKSAKMLVVDIFAHAAGLLLLAHTGRIRMFEASAHEQMDHYIDQQITLLKKA